MIPSWSGSQDRKAFRIGRRRARRRSLAPRPSSLTRLQHRSSIPRAPTLGLHLGHLPPLRQAQIFPPRRHCTLCVIVCVAQHVFIDLFMAIHYRYQGHPMLDLASMRLSRPTLPSQTPSCRQAYSTAPYAAAFQPHHDRSPPSAQRKYRSSSRGVSSASTTSVMPSLPAAEGYVIPHDEAYASTKRHHRSTPQ
jgi:hypothetical protein